MRTDKHDRAMEASRLEAAAARRGVNAAIDAFTPQDLRRLVVCMGEDSLREIIRNCERDAEELRIEGREHLAQGRERVARLCTDLFKARMRQAGERWA